MIRLSHAKGVAACLTGGRWLWYRAPLVGISCHYQKYLQLREEAFCHKCVNEKKMRIGTKLKVVAVLVTCGCGSLRSILGEYSPRSTCHSCVTPRKEGGPSERCEWLRISGCGKKEQRRVSHHQLPEVIVLRGELRLITWSPSAPSQVPQLPWMSVAVANRRWTGCEWRKVRCFGFSHLDVPK